MKANDQETPYTPKAKDIDLAELFQIVKQQLWIVVVTTLFFSGLGFWYSNHHKVIPHYSSSTRIIMETSSDQMNTLLVMFTDPTILSKVSEQLSINRPPDVLASEISASIINNSQIINLQVTDPDPRLAAEIANRDAETFAKEVPKLVNFNKIRQLTPAQVNLQPINPSSGHKYIIYGFLAGLVLGIFLGFLRNSFDESIRSEKELERLLGLPVMGSISKMTKKNSRKYITKRFLPFSFLVGIFRFRKKSIKKENQQNNLSRDKEHQEFLARVHNES